MAHIDNPAGRLHDFLVRLGEQNREGSTLAAWATVFEVEPQAVALYLPRVADLVRQIQRAAELSGEEALLEPIQTYRAAWTQPMVPTDQSFNGALVNVLPDPNAIAVLNLISAQLHLSSPEGEVPNGEELDDLRLRLNELSEEVRTSHDIPDELRQALLSRLRAVITAIEYLDVGGPDAVRYATEAVMGAVVFAQDRRSVQSGTVQKVWTTVLVAWTLFSAGPVIQNSIEAWHEVAAPILSSGEGSSGNEAEAENSDATAAEHMSRE